MAGIFDLVAQSIGESGIDNISRQLGTDSTATKSAIQIALPAIIAGLARNAAKSKAGADSLTNAITRDHDGSVLDAFGEAVTGRSSSGGIGSILLDALQGQSQTQMRPQRRPTGLGGLLGGLFGRKSAPPPRPPQLPRSINGGGILDHVLGNKRGAVETGISRSSGLDPKKVAALLPILAPLVMGALGKMKKQNNLDSGGITDLLRQESGRIDDQASNAPSILDILDRDNDGQIADDLAKIGGALGGAGVLAQILKGR